MSIAGRMLTAIVLAQPLVGPGQAQGPGGADGAKLYTLTACRLVDTRGAPGTDLQANTTRTYVVTGACGVPLDAVAVVLNVLPLAPTEDGHLRVYPAGLFPPPLASTVNFTRDRQRANNATVAIGVNGQIAVYCSMSPGSMGRSHLILDVYGFYR